MNTASEPIGRCDRAFALGHPRCCWLTPFIPYLTGAGRWHYWGGDHSQSVSEADRRRGEPRLGISCVTSHKWAFVSSASQCRWTVSPHTGARGRTKIPSKWQLLAISFTLSVYFLNVAVFQSAYGSGGTVHSLPTTLSRFHTIRSRQNAPGILKEGLGIE